MYDDDAIYRITPKGLATLAMIDAGLITSTDDRRFYRFWDEFYNGLINAGYIERGDD